MLLYHMFTEPVATTLQESHSWGVFILHFFLRLQSRTLTDLGLRNEQMVTPVSGTLLWHSSGPWGTVGDRNPVSAPGSTYRQ